ncbi:MAG: slipin family protein, partial [Chitinophagales bacterium]
MENSDYEKQLYSLLQLAIREFVGTLSLDELLENKEALTKYVQNTVRAKAQKMGLELIDSGVRDIILPGDMKEIINQVLIAQKKAQANMISRREETAATRSLLNTAKLMEENAMLFKLKEMEYIEKIADRIGEITVNGSGNVVKQLNDIFAVKK